MTHYHREIQREVASQSQTKRFLVPFIDRAAVGNELLTLPEHPSHNETRYNDGKVKEKK